MQQIGVHVAEPDGSNQIFIGDRECWDGAGTYHITCQINKEDISKGSGNYILVFTRYGSGSGSQSESVDIKVKGADGIKITDNLSINLYLMIGIIALVVFAAVILFLRSSKKKSTIFEPIVLATSGRSYPGSKERPPPCTNCYGGLVFADEYNKWYCEKCNQYF